MYDACDDSEVRAQLGPVRKRLDARRNTKPKKSDDQKLVCTPFNENGFHFGKIRNDKERLAKLSLSVGRYDVLTNKFPLFPKHCLLIDEFPPVTALPLVPGPTVAGTRCLQPQGFPGFCYVFPFSALKHVDAAISSMQADNQPHNLLFTPRHIYLFPKPLVRPARSFDLYPETVGGPELIGSFTVYTTDVYEQLTSADCEELT